MASTTIRKPSTCSIQMTPLVLIPGMMCDARLYTPQINTLSGRLPIHLAPIATHDSIEKLASEILANTPPQFSLAGLSMGGIVAMEMFAQAPHRIEKIALLDTNPKSETEVVKKNRVSIIERVLAGELDVIMREKLIPHYLFEGIVRQDIENLCVDMATRLGSTVFKRQSQALQARPDQQESLKNINIPTLILCGEDDKLCPIERHELMHSLIPNSKLVIIKQAGHLPTLEQPNAVNSALTNWLEI